jgi:hypothetical protein
VGLVLLCLLQEAVSRTRTAVARQYGATSFQSLDLSDIETSAHVEAPAPFLGRYHAYIRPIPTDPYHQVPAHRCRHLLVLETPGADLGVTMWRIRKGLVVNRWNFALTLLIGGTYGARLSPV